MMRCPWCHQIETQKAIGVCYQKVLKQRDKDLEEYRVGLWEKGLTDTQIAACTGYSGQGIRVWRIRRGLQPRRNRRDNLAVLIVMGAALSKLIDQARTDALERGSDDELKQLMQAWPSLYLESRAEDQIHPRE